VSTTPLTRSAAKLAVSLPLCALLLHVVLPVGQAVTPLMALAFLSLAPAAAFTFLYSVITLWLLLEKLFGKDRF
jgi:hypothetical protein